MKALVIFSGGQDSTTCLGWAIKRYEEVVAINFFYGQKHDIEVQCAKQICHKLQIPLTSVDISFLGNLVDSALTSGGDVNAKHPRLSHLPASFVPNRNALFITLAHAFAQKIGASHLIAGMCETDFSGYPDCRSSFINSIQGTLNLGSDAKIGIVTPLMELTKAEIFELAREVGVLQTVINDSHTCYEGDHTHFHEWGYGCGECPACKLREKGWNEFKYIGPLAGT